MSSARSTSAPGRTGAQTPTSFRASELVLGANDGRTGERWLDIRRLSVLEPIMTRRFKMCQEKRFDSRTRQQTTVAQSGARGIGGRGDRNSQHPVSLLMYLSARSPFEKKSGEPQDLPFGVIGRRCSAPARGAGLLGSWGLWARPVTVWYWAAIVARADLKACAGRRRTACGGTRGRVGGGV